MTRTTYEAALELAQRLSPEEQHRLWEALSQPTPEPVYGPPAPVQILTPLSEEERTATLAALPWTALIVWPGR